jgi:hypothetical protein
MDWVENGTAPPESKIIATDPDNDVTDPDQVSFELADKPVIETIISREQMPSSENSVFTDNGRFFIAGGQCLYEVVKNSDGSYEREIITESTEGNFSGLTADGDILYAGLTVYEPPVEEGGLPMPVAGSLFRIDPTGDEAKIASAPLTGHVFILANGMAVDNQGHIYISNTSSAMAFSQGIREPAIIKVSVTDEANFGISETTWLEPELGGSFPNGIQIIGNTMYMASNAMIFQILINEDGTAGNVSPVCMTESGNILDDFAILPGRLAVAEIDFPYDSIAKRVSRVIMISIDEANTGEIVDKINFSQGILPSSVVLARGGLFKTDSLLVTDVFNGGLYEVSDY